MANWFSTVFTEMPRISATLFVFEAVFFYQFEDDLAFGRELIDGFSEQRHHIGSNEQLFGVEVDN